MRIHIDSLASDSPGLDGQDFDSPRSDDLDVNSLGIDDPESSRREFDLLGSIERPSSDSLGFNSLGSDNAGSDGIPIDSVDHQTVRFIKKCTSN